MAAQVSSPKKPTGKAGTPRRSTTSSTTGNSEATTASNTSAAADLRPENVDEHGAAAAAIALAEAPGLTSAQQARCLKLMLIGASAPMACAALKVSITSFQRSVDEDAEFAQRLQQTQGGLSQNVAARLYRTAMEGNVSAQRYYLQLRPPPEWKDASASAVDLEELEPNELADEYRAAGLDIPAELQALTGRTNGRVES